MDVVTIDAATGEVTERPFTSDEKKQREADVAAWEASQAAHQAAAVVAAENGAAAIAHAKSLGFTDEMISAMYPGLAAP